MTSMFVFECRRNKERHNAESRPTSMEDGQAYPMQFSAAALNT